MASLSMPRTILCKEDTKCHDARSFTNPLMFALYTSTMNILFYYYIFLSTKKINNFTFLGLIEKENNERLEILTPQSEILIYIHEIKDLY